MPAASLASRRDAGGGLTLVALEIDASTAGAYTVPGQYIELRTARGAGYFVLASDAGKTPWELLVRNAGGASETLVTSPVGASLDVSAPIGFGFPVERAAGRALVIAVAGSALAVARPLVRRRIAESDAKGTHVYVGVRSLVEVPLVEELAGWSRAGADVVLCVSRIEPEHEDADVGPLEAARRAEGYVQQAVARDVQTGRIPPTLVFAAGSEAMLDAIRGLPGSVLEVVTNV